MVTERWMMVLAFGLALAVPAPPVSAEGSYDVHKKVTWNVKDATTGKARYTLHALAHDKTLVHVDKPPNRVDGADKWSQDLAQDKNNRTGGSNWYTTWDEFDVSKKAYGAGDQAVADDGRAHADANMSISVGQPDENGVSSSELHVWGTATVKKEGTGTAYAQSAGRAEVRMKGKITTSEWLDPSTKKWVALKLDGSEVVAQGRTGAAIGKDPLSLELYDPISGLTGFSDIFDTEMQATGDASVVWGAGTVTLSAAQGANAALSLSTLGTWVSNKISGQASIENGVFNVTGDLSSDLTWMFDTTGGRLTATAVLPTDFVRLDLALDQFGMDETHDIDVTLYAGRQGVAEDSVPEASTWASLGILLGLGAVFARRGRASCGRPVC